MPWAISKNDPYERPSTRTGRMLTCQLIPTTSLPSLPSAPIVPATWVPWAPSGSRAPRHPDGSLGSRSSGIDGLLSYPSPSPELLTLPPPALTQIDTSGSVLFTKSYPSFRRFPPPVREVAPAAAHRGVMKDDSVIQYGYDHVRGARRDRPRTGQVQHGVHPGLIRVVGVVGHRARDAPDHRSPKPPDSALPPPRPGRRR